MRTKTLGHLRMFGETVPVSYKDESVQIGFRVAKLAGLPEMYAIDEDSDLDDEVFNYPSPAMQEAMRMESDYLARQSNDSISDSLRWWNSKEWSETDHRVYIRANAMGDSRNYLGARTVAGWYERNLKIFSNIQRLAERYRRIFVIYGAGHLYILRELIRADDRLRLADVEAYLPE